MRALWIYGVLLLVALVLPTRRRARPFTAGERMDFPPDGLSLRWYGAFLDSREFIDAARTSFEVAR